MRSRHPNCAPTPPRTSRHSDSASHLRRATVELAAILGATLLSSAPASAQYPGAWVQIPVTGPSARAGHAMVYDAARGVVWLYGGGPADTWAWNGSAWSLAATIGPSPARSNSGIAYDSDHELVVLFGGEVPLLCNDSARFLGDTWTWDGTQWSLASIIGPSRRSSVAMDFDSARGRAVLFGGLNNCGGGLADTWEWNGSSWTEKQAFQPGAHRQPRAWFDSTVGHIRIFGGYDGTYLADMWEWTGTAWNAITQSGPAGRHGHAVAFEPALDRLLLFGGSNAAVEFSDSWLFDGESWTLAEPGPAARTGHAMVYDAAREQIVLFGGSTRDGTRYRDTWIWSVRPVVTLHPSHHAACAGTTVSFFVTVGGIGPFTYQWRKAGVNLEDGGGVSGAVTPTLTLHNTTPADADTYDCVVSNACGGVTSGAATLRISTLIGDLNCDCQVNLADLTLMLANFGTTCP